MKTFIFSLLFVLTFGFNSFAKVYITVSSYCDIVLPEEAKDKAEWLEPKDFNDYLFDKKYLSELQQTDEYIKCYDKAKKDTLKKVVEYKNILKMDKIDNGSELECSPSYIKNGNKLRITCAMDGSLSY